MIEWGVASLTLPGQSESGDLYLVKLFPNGALVAVVDGLGHGQEAASAAKIAIATLESYTVSTSLIGLLKLCHESLHGTRGVVMSLAWFDGLDGAMTWLGVGNVEGRLLRVDPNPSLQYEYLLLRGGVVGRQLPPLRASIIPVMRGETLVFATDGVSVSFLQEVNLTDSPQQIANRILAQHSKGTDDALVLVVRYLGSAP